MIRLLSVLVTLLYALNVWSADTQTFRIGYLEYSADARYSVQRLEARYRLQPWGRPHAGVELGLKDARFPLLATQVKFELQRRVEPSAEALIHTIRTLAAAGTHFFIVDLPDPILKTVAANTQDQPIALLNISALATPLRHQDCQAHLFHIIPSWGMLMDALAQYLVFRKWRTVLVLKGPTEEDQQLHQDFVNSAKRFGLKIVDTRDFELGRDPRQRGQNNVALLTARAEYDAVFVADADGEFARNVPYQTQLPRPTVGSNGLVPTGWFWSWMRHGAPQVNSRFEKQHHRTMTMYDWSGWIAVKTLAEAVIRTKSIEFEPLLNYLRSDELVVDGTKGAPQNFRPWNQQMRQPLFVTSGDGVVARLPLEGFLHPVNNLDTLGLEAQQSACQF